MALEDIRQHIRDKAAEEVRAIEQRAGEERARAEEEWKAKIDAERERLVGDIRRSAEAKLAQAKFMIREKANAELLKTKKSQFDKVFGDALQQLSSLSADDYTAMVRTLLEDIKDEEGEFLTSGPRRGELERAVREAGCTATVSHEAIETVGGFIFRSGRIDRDYRFETLMERVREESLIEVNQILLNR